MLTTLDKLHIVRDSALHILPPGLGPNDPDRISFEAFRGEWYCKRLNYELAQPDGCERDLFDARATYIVVKESGHIVGGCRMIPSMNQRDYLPMEVRGESGDSMLERPCVELSRMIVARRVQPETIRALYRGIFASLDTALLWDNRVVAGYATIEPSYLSTLQARFSPSIFVKQGEETAAVTGTGKSIVHIPMRINIGEWGRWYIQQDALRGADSKEGYGHKNRAAL